MWESVGEVRKSLGGRVRDVANRGGVGVEGVGVREVVVGEVGVGEVESGSFKFKFISLHKLNQSQKKKTRQHKGTSLSYVQCC